MATLSDYISTDHDSVGVFQQPIEQLNLLQHLMALIGPSVVPYIAGFLSAVLIMLVVFDAGSKTSPVTSEEA